MTDPPRRSELYLLIAGLAVLSGAVASLVTGLTVLTAIPCGLLFGFFLQKGDFCGTSALSEVLILKSGQKLFGVWVCIIVTMVGLSVMDRMGWVSAAPNHLAWLSMMVGGTVFGVGMVLSGGCVTGSQFKAGAGNVNSMAALAGIPLGVITVWYGYLNRFRDALGQYVIHADNGRPVTLSSLTGLSFLTLALVFLAVTVIAVIVVRRKAGRKKPDHKKTTLKQFVIRPWKTWQAGVALGLLALPTFYFASRSAHHYPLGTTGGMSHGVFLLIERDVRVRYDTQAEKKLKRRPKRKPRRSINLWLVLLTGSLVLGAFFSGMVSGQAKLLPKPPEQTVVAFFGGILVGGGAALGQGCFIGNGVSGVAMLSLGSMLFAVCMALANWATTYFYMMGGSLGRG